MLPYIDHPHRLQSYFSPPSRHELGHPSGFEHPPYDPALPLGIAQGPLTLAQGQRHAPSWHPTDDGNFSGHREAGYY